MLDFRKVLMALSVAGLGLVGTASAQVVSCASPAGPLAFVAAEGTTEQLPQLVLACSGFTAGTPSGVASFQITTSSVLANQLLSGSTSNYDVVVTGSGAGDTPSKITETGPNTLVVTFASLNPGAGTTDTVTFSNIRVNASTAPLNSTITASVAASGVIISSQPTNYGGFVTKSVGSILVNGTTAAPVAVTNQTTCGLTAASPAFPVSNITVTEGFPDAFRGLLQPPTNGGAAGGSGTAALQGTTLNVTLTNLDTGVNYYVPATLTLAAGSATGSLQLTAVTGPGSTTMATLVTGAAGTPGLGQVLVTAASPTVYYSVTGAGALGVSDSFTVPVTAYIPSVSAIPSYNTNPVGASVVLSGAAAPAYPGYAGTITYTSTLAKASQMNGVITPCATTLLFPYVTNASGFDTGIAIANASTVPASSGIGSAILAPTTGTCALTFYGSGAATAAPVAVAYGTVTTGTVGTPIAMGGSSTAAAGLTGYAVAVCNFVGAHGYAFITDTLGTSNGVAANYVAVVLNSGTDSYNPSGGVVLTPIE